MIITIVTTRFDDYDIVWGKYRNSVNIHRRHTVGQKIMFKKICESNQ